MPLPALCQISENFEEGNISHWTQSPDERWAADKISAISDTFSLHHIFDNPDAGNDQAGIPLLNLRPALGRTRWSFSLKHGCDPSSSNNWAMFLMADNDPSEMHPGGYVNGYAIGVNLTGFDDTLRLWKIRHGNAVSIISTGVNWQTDIGITAAATIDAERTETGKWKLDIFNQEGAFIGSSSGEDPEIFMITWFGIYHKYSSTRDRLLWIDDITVEGTFIADTVAPSVKEITAAGTNSLKIILDEEASSGFSDIANFILNSNESGAASIIRLSPVSWLVTFGAEFENKKVNSVKIGQICDNSGNCRNNENVSFIPVWAEPGDVIISEIMADPLPPVSLPAEEYLELKNNTGFSIDITNWKLIAGGQSITFPGYSIGPGEYLIACDDDDTAYFSGYGRIIGLKPFPVLTDGGKLLVITDSSGNMVHGVEYSDDWYGDVLKSEGGWSLEIIDTSHPFHCDNNWRSSVSRTGGTPGKINSVAGTNIDRSFRGLTNVFPADEKTILVSFSEPVRNLTEIKGKNIIGVNKMVTSEIIDPLGRKLIAGIDNSLNQGVIYRLSLPSGLMDFSGNLIEKRYATFGLPETAVRGDIVFNELLFDPLPGGPDYIELINNSGKTIDASKLYFASVIDATADTSSVLAVSEEPRCILPGALYTLTNGRESLLKRYGSSVDSNIFEVAQMPSMPDDGGHLLLYNRQLDLIDEVKFSDEMHYPLLSETEGISLEKINPRGSSTDSKNWHSASESSGWGTPGAPNSVLTGTISTEDEVIFSSSRITPDNDGNEDVLVMDFSFSGIDNILSVTVFDEGGNRVRRLAENQLAGSGASVTWDGTADGGSLVERGIYIVFISVYDYSGKIQKWKRVCSVLR